MKILAVIPSDPLIEYEKKGIGQKLIEYFNPGSFFDKVYLFSPVENKIQSKYGMEIIPTKDVDLRKRLREYNVDIVRAYGGNWPCDMACNYKIPGVPVVVSIHDKRKEWLSPCIKSADIVFAVSNGVKDVVLTKYNNASGVWVLPNRIDLNVMRPCRANQYSDLDEFCPSKYKILHVGRMSEEKNLETIIRAISILGDEYCLLNIGQGDNSKYQLISNELNLGNRCKFIVRVENSDLPRYYSWANCLCNPSLFEAMSSVLIEAMACGTVVITSEIAAEAVNIKNNYNGIILKDHENPVELAAIISKVCADEKYSCDLKSHAIKSAGQYEKSKIDKMEVSYYQKILKMKKKGDFEFGSLAAVIMNSKNIWNRCIKRSLK